MKDDKKKLIVIGALAAVLMAVGAFTVLGGGGTPPPAPEAAKSDKEKEDGKVAKVDADGKPIVDGKEGEPAKNPLYAMELPQRDPFTEGAIAGEKFNPVLPETSPAPKTQPLPRPNNRPIRRSGGDGGGTRPYIPPFDVTGPLPGAGGGSVSISPEPSNFGYSVSGTMTGGARKIAVFTDTNGNQRMVPEGGSLDGDSKVVAIEKGSVTIEHRGKKQRLSLGGNPK